MICIDIIQGQSSFHSFIDRMVGKQLKTALISQIQLKLVNLAEFTASDTERGVTEEIEN